MEHIGFSGTFQEEACRFKGLDLRLCACSHLLKQEARLVQGAVLDAYVVYGLNVFEHEYTHKERIRENKAHEAEVELAHGGSRKKCRRLDSRQTMLLGVSSGVNTAETCGFSDDDAEEVVSEEEGGVGIKLGGSQTGSCRRAAHGR